MCAKEFLRFVRRGCLLLVPALFVGALPACGKQASNDDENQSSPPSADGSVCELPAAVDSGDHKRLALIVGVGKYANDSVRALPGATADARRMYELLTGENGYGFPKENVCLLLDEQATKANVREAFYDVLVERASAEDVAVLYFAGHGSQVRDANGDEPDLWDETLMMHDARHGDVVDLIDDELNAMLADLHAKTTHIVSILDSCNSGTATRATAAGVPRFHERLTVAPAGSDLESGDGDSAFIPDTFDGMVTLTAASDGTSALEVASRGVFTDALIQVLSEARDQPPTYAQIARQIPPLVSAKSYQVPYFHGKLDRKVFGNASHNAPLGFRVMSVEPQITLAGAPLPGFGTGAELYVYDAAVTGADTRDPSKAKAMVVIDAFSGLNATAVVAGRTAGSDAIREGDIAVLARVGDHALKITVSFRAPGEYEGIPAQEAEQLKAMILEDTENKLLVDFPTGNADFELARRADGALLLRGPENRVRNVYANDNDVVKSLWRHARQRALMQLRGLGGGDFVDNETLEVRLVEALPQSPCASGTWVQAPPNGEQIVPLCHRFRIEVSMTEDAPAAGLLIGGVILATDGNTYGLPADGRRVLLKPGETVIFDGRRELFEAKPPLDVYDRIMVFGTQERNPVPWDQLTLSAQTRSSLGIQSSLHRALHGYLTPGTRNLAPVVDEYDVSTWTMSTIVARVEANSRFLQPESRDASSPVRSREYTIADFNIRPYLPDDEDSALFKVLRTAHWLATAGGADGFDYKQHDWSQPDDEQNLAVGIDCSRAIWFAFTRSGLPYNQADDYLTTAMMVDESSDMSDQFTACPANEDYRLGDILVYRSDERQDGHVVMVVDPAKRIAWGSHGWDGTARASDYAIEPDRGVEYQLIKVKQDWQRWDRRDMQLKSCWRYDRFETERRIGTGQPGVMALSKACDADICRTMP